MSKQKWYGNVVNRIEEGRNYTGRELQVGDDITMYMWSDRYCYYITEVENPKRIKVKRYFVCADHEKQNGMGHQNWLFFKSRAEMDKYLRRFFPDHVLANPDDEDDAETWVFRYGKWKREVICTDEYYDTPSEKKCYEEHGYYKKYYDLSGRVSFGVRSYYYDWEF